MKSFAKNVSKAILERLGYVLMRSSHHAALQQQIKALQRQIVLSAGGGEDRVPYEEKSTDGVDYQILMAQQSVMAALADMEPEFQELFDFVRPQTMTSVERLYDLYKSVEFIVKGGVPGDLIECGVWRGGSMMMVAKSLLQMGDTSRRLYLFDTYEGHPKPDKTKDHDLWGNSAYDEWQEHQHSSAGSDWARVSIEEVRQNMESTGYPMSNVVLVKGKVEDTAVMNAPESIALVRLDTDWYESTRIGLQTFWPHLSERGILIADDYGHYKGQRQAIDEYFAGSPVLMHRVDYSCRSIMKLPAFRNNG